MSQPSESEAKEEDFSWLMPETTEPHGNKFLRKAKENPFVPIGEIILLGTSTSLTTDISVSVRVSFPRLPGNGGCSLVWSRAVQAGQHGAVAAGNEAQSTRTRRDRHCSHRRSDDLLNEVL